MPRTESLERPLQAAARAARQAGALFLPFVGRPPTVETKRSAEDLVTDLDRRSERLIYQVLHRAFPTFGFMGEERIRRAGRSPYQWIVDPIDGTTNFVHGVPLFAVSIGLLRQGRPVAGVIYDPVRRELFSAAAGSGSFLNGRRIRVSQAARLQDALLSTGFSSKFRRRHEPYLTWFTSLESRCHAVRRIGSTTVCLAYIAAGRLDGFYERDLWPWDMAAGIVLVTEAGGRVTDLAGGAPVLERGRLVASNGKIHGLMLEVLAAGVRRVAPPRAAGSGGISARGRRPRSSARPRSASRRS